MESPILAVPGGVELGLEALEGSLCDSLRPSLLPQSITGLPASDDIPFLALLQNEFAKDEVSPLSHSASSTSEVEFSPDDRGGATPRRHAIDPLDSM